MKGVRRRMVLCYRLHLWKTNFPNKLFINSWKFERLKQSIVSCVFETQICRVAFMSISGPLSRGSVVGATFLSLDAGSILFVATTAPRVLLRRTSQSPRRLRTKT